MATEKLSEAAAYYGFQEYLLAKAEVLIARREGRLPNVRLADLADLCARVEKIYGFKGLAAWDNVIVERVSRAYGGTTRGGEDLKPELRKRFGDELLDNVTRWLDVNLELQKVRSEKRTGESERIRYVTVPADVQAVETRGAAVEEDSIPLRAFRFGWKEGTAYHAGDLVQHAGAPWICLQPSKDKPGTSSNWRLLAKVDIAKGQTGNPVRKAGRVAA
jgi:hypothetical protein